MIVVTKLRYRYNRTFHALPLWLAHFNPLPLLRRYMSAYYQLLPTRVDPDGDPDSDGPLSTTLRDPPSFLSRLVAALPFRYGPFRKVNRAKSLWISSEPSNKSIALYAAGGSTLVAAVLGLVVFQERVNEYIMDTFFGPAPPASCLRDPSAASSYVPWRPLAADDQLVYHCVKVPHSSEPPPLRVYQSLPSACRDAFFQSGHICDERSNSIFDLAWTWVNGSDALLHDAMVAAEDDAGHESGVGFQAGQKLYRCVFFAPTAANVPANPPIR